MLVRTTIGDYTNGVILMGILDNLKDKVSKKLGEILGTDEGLGFDELLEKLKEIGDRNEALSGEFSRHITVKDKLGTEFYVQILSISRCLESMHIQVSQQADYVAVRVNKGTKVSVVEIDRMKGREMIPLHDNLEIPLEDFKDMVDTEKGRATIMNLRYAPIEDVMSAYYSVPVEEKVEQEKIIETTLNDWNKEDYGYVNYKDTKVYNNNHKNI